MMKLTNAIGGTIRELRQERNMNLRSLSAKSHVSLGHLSDVERGNKQASNELLESIAFGLDLSPADLIKEIHAYLKEAEDWSK
jgi:transcriptional regulator with XRE-family HTH domain